MRKYKKYTLGILSGFLVFQLWVNPVYASEGEEYITISVDATDDNENLMYALDTDDPSAFSSSNEFVIPAGTTHTIYVKDAAGNITSQEYVPVPTVTSSETPAEYPDNQEYTYVTEEESGFPEDGITIDIDVDNLPDSLEGTQMDPAEPGQGTVYEKVNTDTSQDAERIFYTVTTDEGEVFYLVIDQGQSSNNVYLLDQVNLNDLKALAVDDTGAIEEESSDSLLSALGGVNTESNDLPAESTPSKKSNSSNMIILIIILAIGGGVYYYMKVYKNKKDEQMDIMDAMDKDDFVASDDEEDDLDFGLDENYQEEALERLLEDETEDESAGDEEIYATSHKNMDDENNLTDDNDIPMEYEETEENFDEEDFDPELDREEE